MESAHRIIVLGFTSSLAGSLVSRFPSASQVYGFVRPLTGDSNINTLKQEYRKALREQDNNILIVDYNGSDEDLVHHINTLVKDNIRTDVLYLSTKVSTYVLNCLTEYSNVRVLAIGSGAVTDWGNGREGFDIVGLAQSEGTRGFAKYIEDKARAERISTVTIHPGFYLPEPDAPFTWSGLHLDSCEQIFAPTFNSDFNWGKAKFVTFVGDLAGLIEEWITNPDLQSVQGGYSFGTDRAYQRWELREAAGFTDVPDSVKAKYPVDNEQYYSRNMRETANVFGKRVCSVEDASKSAREWVESHQSEYKRLRSSD